MMAPVMSISTRGWDGCAMPSGPTRQCFPQHEHSQKSVPISVQTTLKVFALEQDGQSGSSDIRDKYQLACLADQFFCTHARLAIRMQRQTRVQAHGKEAF